MMMMMVVMMMVMVVRVRYARTFTTNTLRDKIK